LRDDLGKNTPPQAADLLRGAEGSQRREATLPHQDLKRPVTPWLSERLWSATT
jgi:hypothetical protein